MWVEPGRGYEEKAYRRCSFCGKAVFMAKFMHYCPYCGADNVEDKARTELTFEELTKEASRQGYELIKIVFNNTIAFPRSIPEGILKYGKLLRCKKCNVYPNAWSAKSSDTKPWNVYETYKCPVCGIEAEPGLWGTDARDKWNKLMEENHEDEGRDQQEV